MSYLSALAGVTVGALGGAAGNAAALGAPGNGFATAFARAILLFSLASELRASVPAGSVWYLCGCVSAASVSALFTAPAGGGGGPGGSGVVAATPIGSSGFVPPKMFSIWFLTFVILVVRRTLVVLCTFCTFTVMLGCACSMKCSSAWPMRSTLAPAKFAIAAL